MRAQSTSDTHGIGVKEKLVIGLAMCTLVGWMLGLLFYQYHQKMIVVGTLDAGTVVSIDTLSSPLGRLQTRIVTSTGAFYTEEVPKIIVGSRLMVEYRTNDAIALCDPTTLKCIWLLK